MQRREEDAGRHRGVSFIIDTLGVSDPCVSQNSCEIFAPQLAVHQLHSVMNCDARYASSARSELALIEIFVNLGKMKSVLIRVRPICPRCAPGQVRSD